MKLMRKNARRPASNYRRKIEALIKAGKIGSGMGALTNVEARHDNGCKALRGGDCNCDPDIYIEGVKVA